MSFMELAKARYSVRKFSGKQIEKEKLDQILEAGRIAPTAHNFQPYRVYVLQSKDAIEKIRALTPCAFNAPTVLMVTRCRDEQWVNDMEKGFLMGEVDCAIVATHMMLEAWELGIGSCWVAHFPPTKTAEVFDIPRNEMPVLLMPMGYPEEGVHASHLHEQRRPMEELVKYL
ncbi:MAG: nitroreductase family protein [Acidaminococcus sp.]|jgi:nitroreductase|nr:nitroreductase family protein [Acidaminococcus sp.]MCI2100562.1 nitroreductase family protein [Acidaminococcus sp.]MCI2114893.1 nitroreductase family protein [Acidaminococcus sp.]MCI2116985.1 nitroreductase family protein [Acidaminococcus sp.]